MAYRKGYGTNWECQIHNLAQCDLDWLQDNKPDIYNNILYALDCLVYEVDPRRDPNVKPLYDEHDIDLSGWYRLRVGLYRVMFRLFQYDEFGKPEQIVEGDYVDEAKKGLIEVVRVGHRTERDNIYRSGKTYQRYAYIGTFKRHNPMI